MYEGIREKRTNKQNELNNKSCDLQCSFFFLKGYNAKEVYCVTFMLAMNILEAVYMIGHVSNLFSRDTLMEKRFMYIRIFISAPHTSTFEIVIKKNIFDVFV